MIDKDWFELRLAKMKGSQNEMGRAIGLDGPKMSRTLNGKREMKRSETEAIARYLNVPILEVLKRTGWDMGHKNLIPVRITSIIGPDGMLTPLKRPVELSLETLARVQAIIPPGRQSNFTAANIKANKGCLAIMDGAIVLYENDSSVKLMPKATLSISTLRDGGAVLGHVQSSENTGKAKIKTPENDVKEFEIVSSVPVVIF